MPKILIIKLADPQHLLVLGMIAAGVFAAAFFCTGVVDYSAYVEKRRATECSELLHKVGNDTLTPLTEDASVEIGACLLQFHQIVPTSGENP